MLPVHVLQIFCALSVSMQMRSIYRDVIGISFPNRQKTPKLNLTGRIVLVESSENCALI